MREVLDFIAAKYQETFGDDDEDDDEDEEGAGWGSQQSDSNEEESSREDEHQTLPKDLALKYRDKYMCYQQDASFEHLPRLNQEIRDLKREKYKFIRSIDALSEF